MWSQIGKFLVLLGIIFVVVGVILLFLGKIPWLGRLPGDIHYKGKNWSFHFPIVTCIVLSVILTIVLWFLRHLWK